MRLKRLSTFILIGLTTTALVVGLASARPSSLKSLKAAATVGQSGQRVLEPARKAVTGVTTGLARDAVARIAPRVRRNLRWAIGALQVPRTLPRLAARVRHPRRCRRPPRRRPLRPRRQRPRHRRRSPLPRLLPQRRCPPRRRPLRSRRQRHRRRSPSPRSAAPLPTTTPTAALTATATTAPTRPPRRRPHRSRCLRRSRRRRRPWRRRRGSDDSGADADCGTDADSGADPDAQRRPDAHSGADPDGHAHRRADADGRAHVTPTPTAADRPRRRGDAQRDADSATKTTSGPLTWRRPRPRYTTSTSRARADGYGDASGVVRIRAQPQHHLQELHLGTNQDGVGNGVKSSTTAPGMHDITFQNCTFKYQPRMGFE